MSGTGNASMPAGGSKEKLNGRCRSASIKPSTKRERRTRLSVATAASQSDAGRFDVQVPHVATTATDHSTRYVEEERARNDSAVPELPVRRVRPSVALEDSSPVEHDMTPPGHTSAKAEEF